MRAGWSRALVRASSVALLGCLAPGNAWALLQSCTVAAVPVSFGTYNPVSPVPLLATGTVTLTCTVTLLGILESWTIALSPGNSGSFNNRQMLNGPSALGYNLYADPGYAGIWGDGTGTTVLPYGLQLLQVGSTVVPYVVYGRIPAGQDAGAGTFLDTIVVTLNF